MPKRKFQQNRFKTLYFYQQIFVGIDFAKLEQIL